MASRLPNFLDGVRAGIPVALGYFSVGLAAGVIERAAGLSLLEIVLLSLLLYAGTAQFVTAGMIAASAAPAAIILTVFFINVRLVLYSLALALHCRHLPTWKSVLIGAQLTDSTFAVAVGQISGGQPVNARWLFGLNLIAYVGWAVANLTGGILGQVASGMERLGLDVALPALFVSLIAQQLRGAANRLSAGVTAAVAAVLVLAMAAWVPGNWSTMLASVIAASLGVLIERWHCGRKSSGSSSGPHS